jgi:hypothetical protein
MDPSICPRRASRSDPSLNALTRFRPTSSMARKASASVTGPAFFVTYASTAWHSASIPAAAAHVDGRIASIFTDQGSTFMNVIFGRIRDDLVVCRHLDTGRFDPAPDLSGNAGLLNTRVRHQEHVPNTPFLQDVTHLRRNAFTKHKSCRCVEIQYLSNHLVTLLSTPLRPRAPLRPTA